MTVCLLSGRRKRMNQRRCQQCGFRSELTTAIPASSSVAICCERLAGHVRCLSPWQWRTAVGCLTRGTGFLPGAHQRGGRIGGRPKPITTSSSNTRPDGLAPRWQLTGCVRLGRSSDGDARRCEIIAEVNDLVTIGVEHHTVIWVSSATIPRCPASNPAASAAAYRRYTSRK